MRLEHGMGDGQSDLLRYQHCRLHSCDSGSVSKSEAWLPVRSKPICAGVWVEAADASLIEGSRCVAGPFEQPPVELALRDV